MKKLFLSVFLTLFCQSAWADITTGLILDYHFDEGSGTTSTDSSSQGNTGNFTNNPSWVLGKIGPFQLQFNGTSQYVKTTNNIGLTFNGAFSIAAWIYINSSQNTAHAVIMGTGIESSPFDGVWIQFSPHALGNVVGFSIDAVTGSQENLVYNNSAVTFNTPTCWVFTYDGSQTVAGMKIYIGGSSVATTTGNNAGFAAFTNRKFAIGADAHTSPVDFFTGKVDEARVYTRALTSGDVTEYCNYTAGSVLTTGGTVTMGGTVKL